MVSGTMNVCLHQSAKLSKHKLYHTNAPTMLVVNRRHVTDTTRRGEQTCENNFIGLSMRSVMVFQMCVATFIPTTTSDLGHDYST